MDFIPVNTPLLNGNEKKYLNECIDTGWISSEGRFVGLLEAGMASYVGRKYGIAVCNGSVALDLAVEALNLQAGDEVIMPVFTIISCASPLVKRGIKPVLVDACEDTWNMDVSQIKLKINERTKAIMVVHIYGMPVEMQSVMEIAEKYNLKVIEDAAEAHGLECLYNGIYKKCGSFGDISIMSFYPNKHVTTGEGGMVLTDDEELNERCRYFRNLCFKPERRFVHEELGYNYRMSNIQAAIGVAQLEKIEEHILLKRKIGQLYTELLQNNSHFYLPVSKKDYATNIYWVYGLIMKENLQSDACQMIKLLAEKSIGCRPFFWPMHLQPVFRKMGLFENEAYPVAEYIAERGFYIPSGLGLSEEQIEIVAKILWEI